MTKIFVNKNAIKPYFSPKWGKTYGVGNVLGIFANFPGNSGKNFIATLAPSHRRQRHRRTAHSQHSQRVDFLAELPEKGK